MLKRPKILKFNRSETVIIAIKQHRLNKQYQKDVLEELNKAQAYYQQLRRNPSISKDLLAAARANIDYLISELD